MKKRLLLIELVPAPLWGESLASNHPSWYNLRHDCYRNAGWKCEICGGAGSRHAVEAHEVWKYIEDNKKGTQKLIRLIALCPSCHKIVHYGRSSVVCSSKQLDRLVKHCLQVNDWTQKQFDLHVKFVFDQWDARNKLSWTQDLSFLDNYQPRKMLW